MAKCAGVVVAGVAVGVGLSACGASTVVITSSTHVLSQDKQRLERAIAGAARRNVRHYWTGRARFAINTECRPTTPDRYDWACSTSISSPRPGTTTCKIKTVVHGTKRAFHFEAPLPFARNVLVEGCVKLRSELNG